MKQTTCRAGLMAVLLFSGLLPAAAAAATRNLSVEEFNAEQTRWADVDLDITVEGRWSLIGKDQLKFKNCNVFFRSEKPLPALLRKSTNLEATGRVVRDREQKGEPIVFQVRSIREMPTDLETYHLQRLQIRTDNAAAVEAYYKLGEWAERRGKFYKDAKLLELAHESKIRGFNIERRQLPKDDSEARFRLAAEARKRDFPESLALELIHEGYQSRRQATLKEKSPAWDKLAEEIARELPGTEEPLTEAEARLRADYHARPLELYQRADAAQRRKLHRILWSDIALASIQRQADANGGNGFEIAELIDQRVPEFHSLAEEYRDRALALRSEKVDKLSQNEVLALRQEYRDREQARQGDNVVESWLTLRRKRLDPGDTEGLLNLAEEYTNLLNRPDVTTRLLQEAAARQPKAAEIAARLEQLGYRQKDGRWMTEAEFKAIPEGRLEKAMREGRVETGMTAPQVIRCLGLPLTSTRIASLGQISEIWTYGQAGSSHLVVYLAKQQGKEEAKVIGIDGVGGP